MHVADTVLERQNTKYWKDSFIARIFKWRVGFSKGLTFLIMKYEILVPVTLILSGKHENWWHELMGNQKKGWLFQQKTVKKVTFLYIFYEQGVFSDLSNLSLETGLQTLYLYSVQRIFWQIFIGVGLVYCLWMLKLCSCPYFTSQNSKCGGMIYMCKVT